LDFLGVVSGDVVVELDYEVIDRSGVFAVVHLRFEMAEEVFVDRVIETLAPTRYRLYEVMSGELIAPGQVLILEALRSCTE